MSLEKNSVLEVPEEEPKKEKKRSVSRTKPKATHPTIAPEVAALEPAPFRLADESEVQPNPKTVRSTIAPEAAASAPVPFELEEEVVQPKREVAPSLELAPEFKEGEMVHVIDDKGRIVSEKAERVVAVKFYDGANHYAIAGRNEGRVAEKNLVSATKRFSEKSQQESSAESEETPEQHFLRNYIAADGEPMELTEAKAIKIEKAREQIPEAAKQLANFWGRRIHDESRAIVGGDLTQLFADHLDRVAMNNPEAIENAVAASKVLETGPAMVAEKEKEIDEMLKGLPDYESLAQKREELAHEKGAIGRQKKAVERPVKAYERLKSAQGKVGRFARTLRDRLFGKPAGVAHSEQELAEKGTDWQERITSINEELGDIDKNIQTYEQSDALKGAMHEVFREYRENLFDSLAPVQEMTLRAADNVEKRLIGLMSEGSLESLQKAQVYLEKVRSNEDGLDFTPNIDTEKFQGELDYLIAGAVNKELDDQIEQAFAGLGFDPNGDGVYGDLEKAVEPYLGLEKLGSKNAKRTRKFFANVLRNKIDELDGPDDEMKRVLLKRLVAKHGLFDDKVAFIRGKNGEGIWQTE